MTLPSVDPFYQKVYHEQDYNCLHFSAEVWKELTGQDILGLLASWLEGVSTDKRRARALFHEILRPEDPCLVVMQRTRLIPHLGVYLRGRVLHINPPPVGVEFQPVKVASRGFLTTRFFQCRQ